MKQMKWKQFFSQFILWFSMTLAKDINDVELPLFTTQSKYFLRQRPVHIRMPRNIENNIFGRHDFTQFPALPPNLPNPVVPMQGFSQFPGMPGFHLDPISGPMHGPDHDLMFPMPGPMLGPMPGFNPLSIPMPMAMQGQRNKQPVIVYHQKLRSSKKKKSRHHTSDDTFDDSDDIPDTSQSEDIDKWKGHKKKTMKKDEIKRRSNSHHHHRDEHRKQHHHHHHEKPKKKTELLTPMLQYVTKDGYVIFEKKISKKEANDWLTSKEQPKLNKEELVVKKDVEFLHEQKQKIKTKAINIDEIMKNQEKDSLERSAEINAIKESSHTEQPKKKYKKRKKIYYTHFSDLGHNSS